MSDLVNPIDAEIAHLKSEIHRLTNLKERRARVWADVMRDDPPKDGDSMTWAHRVVVAMQIALDDDLEDVPYWKDLRDRLLGKIEDLKKAAARVQP